MQNLNLPIYAKIVHIRLHYIIANLHKYIGAAIIVQIDSGFSMRAGIDERARITVIFWRVAQGLP